MKSEIKLIFFVSLLAVSVAIFSCKKDDDEKIIVSGIVTNPQNGSPVSGVNVSLDGKVLNGGVYNDNYSEIASATSDATGKFEINADYQVVSSYRIRTFKINYFDESNIISSESLQKGSSYTNNLSILPVGWIRLNINNVVNLPGDEIHYKYASTPQSCYDCCSNEYLIGTGNYHATYKCKVVGNIYSKFYWTVSRNGMINPFTDSVYCAAFDTAVLNIGY